MVRSHGVPHSGLRVAGVDSSSPWTMVRACVELPVAIARAARIIRKFRADVVVGTAGYVCVPVVVAAHLLRKPVVLLEQNRTPGKAVRLLSRYATVVATSYEETARDLIGVKSVPTGNPVRAELLELTPRHAKTCSTILVMGGSQGAHRLNVAVEGMVRDLLEKHPLVSVVHQTGSRDIDHMLAIRDRLPAALLDRYRVGAFFGDIGTHIANADLVVMRAGGSSLAECSVMGRSMILVPYPFANGHQIENARPYVEQGAATLILDHDCSSPRLLEEIEEILGDSKRWRTMAAASQACGRRDAARDVAALIYGVVN